MPIPPCQFAKSVFILVNLASIKREIGKEIIWTPKAKAAKLL